jgi:multidrug efflux pump subunit AcrA (membrane-fusion protein)
MFLESDLMDVMQVFSFLYHKKRWFLVVVLVLVVGAYVFSVFGQADGVVTTRVGRGDVVNIVNVSGNVDTSTKVDVFSTTNGVVEEMYVSNGDFVVEGQELFKVKSTASEQEKSAAYASYLAAVQARLVAQQGKLLLQSQLEQARQSILDAEAERTEQQHHINYGEDNSDTGLAWTQNEKDSLDSAVVSAKQYFANVEKQYLEYGTKIGAAAEDEEAKRLAWEATQSQVVVSPIAGVVVNVIPLVGDMVKIENVQNPVDPVLSLSNLSNFTVTVPVKESDIFKIALGQRAVVELDVLSEERFEGEVFKIDGIGEKVNGVVSYNVTLSLVGTDERIRQGMTALANIETEKKEGVLVVDNSVVRKNEQGSYVVVLEEGRERERQVELGLKGYEYTEVVSGLVEGDVVVLPEVADGGAIQFRRQ